jgi:hypothetical protein
MFWEFSEAKLSLFVANRENGLIYIIEFDKD